MIRNLIPLAIAALFSISVTDADAQRLVILHTNDTHSQIDPDADGMGGVLRRKVLIDSVRKAQPNVLLVDAGDAWQGSLFFTLFDGEVEQKMLNALGYDIQILGNHEFDNGMEALARKYQAATPTRLSTNYDFRETPLDSMFVPYVIREIDNRKVGIIAINIDPKGLIDPANCIGLKYENGVEKANATAWFLKNIVGVDRIIAITHIGYPYDVKLARETENIDVVIGGHSHTLINPQSGDIPYLIDNKAGRPVLIAQLGKGGKYLGEIDIDFDKGTATSRIIPVNSRLDKNVTPADEALLTPYRFKVDSIKAIKVGTTALDFPRASWQLRNLLSDFATSVGERISGKPIDMGLVNIGGIRNSLPKGTVTQGHIIEMLPFNNRVVVLELKGKDLIALFDKYLGEQAVSASVKGRRIKGSKGATDVTINGKRINPKKTYRIATIDYLANGGDSMEEFTNGTVIARSTNLLYRDLINEFENGRFKDISVSADPNPRIVQ